MCKNAGKNREVYKYFENLLLWTPCTGFKQLVNAVAGDEAQVLRQDPGTPAPGQCGAQPLPEQMKTSLASLTVAVLPRSHWLFGPLAHAHAPPLCI